MNWLLITLFYILTKKQEPRIMKERTLKELYQIVLNEFDYLRIEYLNTVNSEEGYYSGICYMITRLNSNKIITDKEEDILYQDFHTRRPTIFSRFWWNNNFNKNCSYWWTRNKKGDIQRKKFLKHLINRL